MTKFKKDDIKEKKKGKSGHGSCNNSLASAGLEEALVNLARG